MERIKRQLDDIVYDNNDNKKQKVEHELIKHKPYFENLANETIYEIFQYLDVYHAYEGFFNLNRRFKNLVVHRNLFVQINVTTMSKSNLDDYHNNMIKPNKYRINYMRLSNPFTVDLIFSPPRTICDYIQLETLVLDNIDTKYLVNILKHLSFSPKLHSLVFSLADYVQQPASLFHHIFCLSKLKYCKVTYQEQYDKQPIEFYLNKTQSPIEYLIINNRFSLESLHDILCCLPKLRYLSIDCLVGANASYIYQLSTTLKHLKHVSIKVDHLRFYLFQQLIKTYFSSIEVLHLTTHDPTYLAPGQWEQLILSSMPNLRIFDIYHTNIVQKDDLIYLLSIYQFDSSFWTQRKWFITHKHNTEIKLDRLILYSTNPYRREDYTFYSDFYPQLHLHSQEKNFNSVKHVHISSKYLSNYNLNCFPNVNELTIEEHFNTSDNSISTTLSHILPLKQLTKLTIKRANFTSEQIIDLIRLTPNLSVLKLDSLSFNGIQQNENFQYVSNTNKINTIEIRQSCSLENFQIILDLFRQVEYLKIGMNRKEVNQIIRFLSSKINNKTCRLCFLCILQIPKVCLRELNALIRSEHLFKNYSIKYINRDLYLWW
ncbi:unnamed protein product [Rotaria socialis]|uniref:F-box domain-containing protein n=1 Tax=Rotaria socialis TaxID=392032 RepID=A0A820IUI4_9BILA|nr:unnamed protein product [Rotaria socialis]CAF3311617.1 unnamed protein product [Rotaria socialis]CAF3731496.1 unnamed protein product [Rotaria socialis]CAF4154770.1 unnamed protein product [Rotaria socialis]CAF4313273.1 unnamed protein product [Rotaria socialis]